MLRSAHYEEEEVTSSLPLRVASRAWPVRELILPRRFPPAGASLRLQAGVHSQCLNLLQDDKNSPEMYKKMNVQPSIDMNHMHSL